MIHQKKHSRTAPGMKLVRIDSRTEILVPESRSDEEARSRFNARYEAYTKYAGQGTPHIPSTSNMPVKVEFKEIPVGSIEDLAAAVENLTLPETE